MSQAKDLNYNGVVLDDFKFHILGHMKAAYFRNLEQVRSAAQELELALYPVVAPIGYSNGLLTNDPNLAEGVPVIGAPFRAYGDRAETEALAQTKLDIDQQIKLTPFRQYHLSVKVKTDGFVLEEQRPAIISSDGRSIGYFDGPPLRMQDWAQHHVVFNSLNHARLELRPFSWLKGSGHFLIKNASLEEIALVNVIRRPGAPLTVTNPDGLVYREGADFVLEEHPFGLMMRPGEYRPYHRPLRLLLPTGSRIRDGQDLFVSYYHALVIREGSVTHCLSAPDAYALIQNQITRLQEVLQPKGFVLGIDEVRVANWCDGCQKRNTTPAALLAENVRQCVNFVKQANPSAEILVWSDMFDPFHNAHDRYYLANGDLSGSWEGLDDQSVVANWNFTAIAPSLNWFASRGHRQVICAYFDRDSAEIGEWKKVSANLPGIAGAIYMTWREDYHHLKTFAETMWNHGTATAAR